MALTRRGFLRNLGIFAGALGVNLSVFKPQEKKREVFRIQPAPDNSYLVGYKGSTFINTGIVYAPYIPLIQTCMLVNSPPMTREFAQRYSRTILTSGRNLVQLD